MTHGEQGLPSLVQPLGQGGVLHGFLSHVEAFLKPGVNSRSQCLLVHLLGARKTLRLCCGSAGSELHLLGAHGGGALVFALLRTFVVHDFF